MILSFVFVKFFQRDGRLTPTPIRTSRFPRLTPTLLPMKKSFYFLALTALVVGGCSPRATPPETPVSSSQETRPEQTTSQETRPEQTTSQETQPEQTTSQEARPEQTTSQEARPEQTTSNVEPRPTQAPALEALRRRQAKAERLAANHDLVAAAQEADYVASQIRIAELDRRGSNGDGQDAKEYATLLESALTTLEQCSRQSERSNRDVSSSEPTSVLL